MLLGSFLVALFLTGCGSSGSGSPSSASAGQSTTAAATTSQSTTSEQTTIATQASQALSSPALAHGAIPVQYTCDGADVSPPVKWSRRPANMRELALLLVDTTDNHYSFEWALAGLKATLSGLPAGKRPAGTILGRNNAGQNRYSLCPPKRKPGKFILVLYQSPHKLGLRTGFTAQQLLTRFNHGLSVAATLPFNYERP